MSFAAVFQALGWLIGGFALVMLAPAVLALATGDGELAWSFAASAGLTGFVAGALLAATQGAAGRFGKRESYLFLCLLWLVLSGLGALPLYFAELPGGPIGALFEAASGLTTTGASVLDRPEESARAVLLWRALLQGVGGGLSVVLAVLVLSGLGVGGLDLLPGARYRREAASLGHRALGLARAVAGLYLVLSLACAALLWLAGMPLFEAVCHALSTLSTGGFSTRGAGIAAFESAAVELVLALFMLLGATNFMLFDALANRRWGAWREHAEGRYLLALALAAVGLSVLIVLYRQPADVLGAARFAAFAAVSALTTTGYLGAGAEPAQALAPALTIALLLAGGAAGSTAGGLKLLRVAVMVKQAARELGRLIHAHAVLRVRLGATVVDDAHIWAVWSFFFVFVVSLAGAAVALAACGLDPVWAIAAAITALANAGPAIAMIAPDAPAYGELAGAAKLWLIAAMILGRIELLTFIVLLNPAYWRH